MKREGQKMRLFALNSSNNGEDFGGLVNLFAPHFDISV